MLPMTCPRTGAGTRAHARCAAFARRAASTKVRLVPSSISVTTSEVFDGFVET